MTFRSSIFRTLALTLGLSLPVSAQTTAAPEPAQPQEFSRWRTRATFGYGGASGGYGEFLERPMQLELDIAKSYSNDAWRLGGGFRFGSTKLDTPYTDELEWAQIETFGTATRLFGSANSRVRPYVQGRVGFVRVHPRSELFWFDDPENLEVEASTTYVTDGISFTLQPGVELALSRSLTLDVGGFFRHTKTGDYSTVPPRGPVNPAVADDATVSSGQEFGLSVGLTWRPTAGPRDPLATGAPALDPVTGQLRPLPPADATHDAWGVRRSWAWATAEMLAINFGASALNEYRHEVSFSSISPRSFKQNFDLGFDYDDNYFKTNQLIHPFNGATYFNSARANGIGFWGSSALALTGAFVWECCGETHPMSYNDMIATGIGGIARGEMAYRISSAILDNTKRGKGRFGREAAAFLVNPVRGFNRMLSGDASQVEGNPMDPHDWRPPFLDTNLRLGARVIGEGESITENTNTYGFAEVSVAYGNAWDTERHGPFDRFDMVWGVNFGDKTAVGKLLIRGDLHSWSVGDGEKHTFALQQDFDYIDNEAYEYGGQSLGAAFDSRFKLSPSLQLWSRLQGYVILLAGINSDYAFLLDVHDQVRLRDYDYGPGFGGAMELFLLRKGSLLANLRYRISHIVVRNGSIYNDPEAQQGLDADHDVHQLQSRLDLPLNHRWALGVDGTIFFRRSRYNFSGSGLPPEIGEGKQVITQRNPEIRTYVSWRW